MAARSRRPERRLADPDRVLAIRCDVSKPAQVGAAVAPGRCPLRTHRRPGQQRRHRDLQADPRVTFADWSRVLATNLSGAFICTQACAPVMLKGRRRGDRQHRSISGLRASTLRVAYGTSKAGLIHLTKQQAAELGTVGIRVNCIAPGPVDTAMAKLVHTWAIRQDYHDVIPLDRYGTVEEIAAAAAFLCSRDASYVNGQTLAVDGGFESTGGRATHPAQARQGQAPVVGQRRRAGGMASCSGAPIAATEWDNP
jgi:NAD(P)-dependent dehydrogenase (short-subunit alcohol dehydrogenase family)